MLTDFNMDTDKKDLYRTIHRQKKLLGGFTFYSVGLRFLLIM